jgi:hypothetical protein
MIAQRKPNQDKGFEELHGCGADKATKLPFLLPATFNRGLKPSPDGAWRWYLPTFSASFSPFGELRAGGNVQPACEKTLAGSSFLIPHGGLGAKRQVLGAFFRASFSVAHD